MFLALRDMRRAKVRFGLLIVAVGLLVFLTLFLQTLLGNLLGYFTGALAHQSGTVVVYSADARKNLSGSILTPQQVAAVATVPGVGESGPLGVGAFTVRATANGASRAKELDAFLFGYEPGKPGAPTTLSRGRLPRGPDEGVASATDADNGFGLGQIVRIVPGTPDAPPLDIRIVGLATDARFSVQPTVFVTYDTFTRARHTANPAAAGQPVLPSAVVATPAPGTSPGTLAATITRTVPGTEALTRSTAVASLPGVASVNQSFALLIALTVFIVFLVTAFFFLILTVQKTAAFTLLRATGASVGYLARALLVEVCVVLVGGFLVGLGFLALAAAFSSPKFPIAVNLKTSVVYAVVIIVLGFLGACFSLWRIRRLDPASATTTPTLGGLT